MLIVAAWADLSAIAECGGVTDVGQAGELERVASAGLGRRYRTIEIQTGSHIMTATSPTPVTSTWPPAHPPNQPTFTPI
jgi:hypothetical protein